jgi:HD superfamily phosphodiesterase
LSTSEVEASGLTAVALHDRVVLVVDGRALARQHHPVAVFEIADRIGERPERDRVRPQIHLAIAVTDRQRRAVAGADHQVVVAGEDEAERERAAQFRQRRPHRLDRLDALLQQLSTRCSTISVSVSVLKTAPFFSSASRNSRKFSMMPL